MNITSSWNKKIKLYKMLQKRKYRKSLALVPLEGPVLIKDALEGGAAIVWALAGNDFVPSEKGSELISILKKKNIPVFTADSSVLKGLSLVNTPPGIFCAARMPSFNVGDIVRAGARLLILDQVQDPGNLGTLFRTALAGGMTGVICMKGTVDPWNPKVVRATMGAAFKLPVAADVVPEALLPLLQRGSLPLYFLIPGTPKVYFDVVYPDAYGIVVGNENSGISPALKACQGEEISIPLIGPIESLNAGVAGGIVMYEALRQKVLRETQ